MSPHTPRSGLESRARTSPGSESYSMSNDPDAAGFYLQQAMEKYLKAFLLSKKWKLKRTHDLEVLLNEAVQQISVKEPAGRRRLMSSVPQ